MEEHIDPASCYGSGLSSFGVAGVDSPWEEGSCLGLLWKKWGGVLRGVPLLWGLSIVEED